MVKCYDNNKGLAALLLNRLSIHWLSFYADNQQKSASTGFCLRTHPKLVKIHNIWEWMNYIIYFFLFKKSHILANLEVCKIKPLHNFEKPKLNNFY